MREASPSRQRSWLSPVRHPPARKNTVLASPTAKSRSETPLPIAARHRPSAWSAKAGEAYVRKINAEGGINGRKIRFVSYDDAYSPPKTVEQTRKLVESDEVLFVFNALGTATNSAVQKYLERQEGAAAVRLERGGEVERPGEFSMDDGIYPELPERRPYLRKISSEGETGRARSRSCFRTTTSERITSRA